MKVCLEWKVYSAHLVSLDRHPTQIISKKKIRIEHNGIKNPNWQAATCWLFINVAEDLKS